MYSPGCIKERKVDYYGNDILHKVVGVGQEEACAELCALTADGFFWTLDVHGTCWVKSSDNGKATHESAVSGNRECGTPGLPLF